MSVSALSSSKNELSCYFSAFQADDTMIEIVPSFNYDGKLPLLSASSSCAVSSFKAGLAASVPLWLAIFLHQRSLCTVRAPAWLSTENLVEIIAYERKEGSLWMNSTTDGGVSNNDTANDDSDSCRLPFHYYEIATRLTAREGIVSDKSVHLLVQDLLQVRVDKLRQQFQQLLSETNTSNNNENDDMDSNNNNKDLMVAVNGIASQELNILKPFVVQALNDQNYLSNKTRDQEETAKASGGGGTAAGGSSNVASASAAADSNAPPALRSRVPIRRFRS